MVALEHKEDEIADVLIEYGARFNERDQNKDTILMRLVLQRDKEAVNYFIEK